MNRRNLSILIILFLLLGILASCGEDEKDGVTSPKIYGAVTGRVTSEFSGEPLPLASVAVEGVTITTVADAEGKYVLNDLPVGRQVISISAEGYKTKRIEIHVQEGTTVIADGTLAESDDVTAIRAVLKIYDEASFSEDIDTLASLISENYNDGEYDKLGFLANREEAFGYWEYLLFATTLQEISVQGNRAIVKGMRNIIAYYTVVQPREKYTDILQMTILLERNQNGTWLITNVNKMPKGGYVWVNEFVLCGGGYVVIHAATHDEKWTDNTRSATLTDWTGNVIEMEILKEVPTKNTAVALLRPPLASGTYQLEVTLVSIEGESYVITHTFDVK